MAVYSKTLQTPRSLEQLIQALRCLPGVGPKSAQRMAYHLLQHQREGAAVLAQALLEVLQSIQHCERCNTFTESPLCAICADEAREQDLLCVVETPADMLMMEQSKCFQGYYFVLMGRLSPLDGMGTQQIALDKLLQRACEPSVKEVVLANNFTVEGEATAHYIAQLLKARGIAVSRIARGLPVGGELEYVDGGTLAQAFIERRQVS